MEREKNYLSGRAGAKRRMPPLLKVDIMAGFRTLDQADVKGKRVLLRVDLNVPMENGKVTERTRIERAAETINELADKGAKVILLAHFGRPKKGPDPKYTLKPVADTVAEVINRPVAFASDCIGPEAEKAVAAMKHGGRALSGEHAVSPGRRKE